MALMYSKQGSLGATLPEFSLPGVDGQTYSNNSFHEARVLVLVVMCNHCPYVKATMTRINEFAKEYQNKNVKVVGINPNDAKKYPDDSFDAMKQVSKEQGFVFPYLWDETQETAKALGAVCTPEFYAYQRKENQFVLRYLGRLDDNWKEPEKVTKRELALAVDQILDGKSPGESLQKPAMGCSIKWKS